MKWKIFGTLTIIQSIVASAFAYSSISLSSLPIDQKLGSYAFLTAVQAFITGAIWLFTKDERKIEDNYKCENCKATFYSEHYPKRCPECAADYPARKPNYGALGEPVQKKLNGDNKQ